MLNNYRDVSRPTGGIIVFTHFSLCSVQSNILQEKSKSKEVSYISYPILVTKFSPINGIYDKILHLGFEPLGLRNTNINSSFLIH